MAERHPADSSRRPAWAERLLSLAESIRDGRARDEFWLLLNLVIAQRLLHHSRRFGPVARETIQDLASQKALDLVSKLDCGQWKPLESTAGELVNFISTVARNALVDELRRPGRIEGKVRDEPDLDQLPARNPESVFAAAERGDFVAGFIACAGRLKSEHRTIWLFRVLYEMPTEAIARHPEVQLKPAHVDVILGRCRHQIRQCLTKHGIDGRHVVPGTYSDLWRAFRFEGLQSRAAHD